MVRDYDYLTETVQSDHFSRWEEVDLEIYAFTDLGMKVAINDCLLYTSPSPRDLSTSRMPSSA